MQPSGRAHLALRKLVLQIFSCIKIFITNLCRASLSVIPPYCEQRKRHSRAQHTRARESTSSLAALQTKRQAERSRSRNKHTKIKGTKSDKKLDNAAHFSQGNLVPQNHKSTFHRQPTISCGARECCPRLPNLRRLNDREPLSAVLI